MFKNKNIKKILDTIDKLEEYIEDQNGHLNIENTISNQSYKIIEDKIIELLHKIESQRSKDMKVFGELMLVCEKISDGFTEDRITQVTTDHKINYIAKTVNSMAEKLDSTLNKTFEILNEYKEQDFRRKVDTDFFRGGKLQELLFVINQLQEGIVNRVSGSYTYGNKLINEANLLKDNTKVLLDSSQNQINEITHTINAVDNISKNVSNNTKITKEMERLAHDLKESSNDSMQLIDKTNKSMNVIDETTTKVSEAITVISQIAFQTNILSLNAAVEAATAGEAGKGFAVVAGEVRNLASRSAEAANTINGLIEELREKTSEGANASTETIQKYDNLNGNIDETIKMINQIVQSSTEQYSLIEDINSSIKNIEHVVDQNNNISVKIEKISQNNFEIASKLVESTNSVKF